MPCRKYQLLFSTYQVSSIQTTDNAIKVFPNPARDYVIFELTPSVISKSIVIPNTGAGTSAGVSLPAGEGRESPLHLEFCNFKAVIH
ncbi:MAG: hypothetical protein ISS18_12610 [Bacteroidales bacterium]|nr:hypothetical protein [Bacteroidales bacterium]